MAPTYTIQAYPALARAYTIAPPNRPINALVVHSTGGKRTGDLWALSGREAKRLVSVHAYFTKTGEIFQLVPDNDIAWHAGVSALDGQPDVNRFSLGMELENLNDGKDPYPQVQIDAAIWWCRKKVQQYAIPRSRFVRHADVALPAGRKVDPNPPLDWAAFVQQVYAPRVPRYVVTENDVRLRTGPSTKTPPANFGNGPIALWAGFAFDAPETVPGETVTLNGITSDQWRHWVDPATGNENGFVWAGLTQEVPT